MTGTWSSASSSSDRTPGADAAWILTKNIWVSTGAHIINDWLLFTLGLLAPVW